MIIIDALHSRSQDNRTAILQQGRYGTVSKVGRYGYGYAKPSRSNAVGVVWARNVPKRDGVLEAEKH